MSQTVILSSKGFPVSNCKIENQANSNLAYIHALVPLLVFDQDNLRRFKKEQYQLTRNEDIIGFFSEFDNYITEDEMWALRSLQIKSIDTVNLCFT